jgi:DNA alkylation damage repair protein AlkB
MLHRDLSDPKHQTNMHLHYTLPYPSPSDSEGAAACSQHPSFFTLAPDSAAAFTPKDPDVHKPLTPRQVLNRRLHWVTLGGQYDWTNRVYPGSEPPRFPADLSRFLEKLFPETLAQAAIVNFYSPGDTMMMHRDVSEETDKGLVSLSFGCDCLFMIAPSGQPAGGEDEDEDEEKTENGEAEKKYLLLRLRSGDAIYMTNESRYAWHGVPKVIKGTCPDYLEAWPAEDGQYAEWDGWMKNKRINLNVRQMRD